MVKISFHSYGDRALLLQWDQHIAPEINGEVIRLSRKIEQAGLPGVRFLIPAYCSLTIGFDPELTSLKDLSGHIKSLAEDKSEANEENIQHRKLIIPVCYEGACAPDLDWVSQKSGLSSKQIIQLHTGTTFRVFLLGFLPGFPYLGTLPKVLDMPRKKTPRLRVPAGSVGLAGLQTGIYPQESPGGWQIIGRTPRKIFDPQRSPPFLLQPGDQVQFRAITLQEFNENKH